MFFQLDDASDAPFPDPSLAEIEPNGLLAMGGDLTVTRLINAYKNGIFPWFMEGEPLLWWSPDPRLVLFPEKIHISKSLKKIIRQKHFKITMDQCFNKVMQACSEPRAGESQTWISEDMKKAYFKLHQAGFAHSFEVWRDKQLVGGLYGVEVNQAFFGESMFSRESNTSKLALTALTDYVQANSLKCIDCQVSTAHLRSMGAIEISRLDFLSLLQR